MASAYRSKVHPTTLPLQLLVTGVTTTSQNHGITTTTTTNATTIDSNHSLLSVLCVRLVVQSFYDANLMGFFSPRPTSRSPLHSPKSPANPTSFSLPRRFLLYQNTTRRRTSLYAKGAPTWTLWPRCTHVYDSVTGLQLRGPKRARARARTRAASRSEIPCESRTYQYYVASDATFSDAKKFGSGRHYVASQAISRSVLPNYGKIFIEESIRAKSYFIDSLTISFH